MNLLPERCKRRRIVICRPLLDVIAAILQDNVPIASATCSMACARSCEQARAFRMMPHELPPWWVVYQQTKRPIAADCFTALVDDLRLLLR